MKTFYALILFISSWCSTQGCGLNNNRCASKPFETCQFTPDCRALKTLNLANKQLTGVVPGIFKARFGTDIQGDPDNGVPTVVLEKLYLQQNAISGNIGIILTPTLEEVNLSGNPFTSANQVLPQQLPSLKKLDLAGTLQTDLKWIGDKLPNLEYLNLANNQLTDEGLLSISKLSKLTQLDLSGNSQLTDLTALVTLTKLKTLKVGNDAALQKQVLVLTSGAAPETKRSQIMSKKMSDIENMAKINEDSLNTLKVDVDGKVSNLNDFSNNLEQRVLQLEQRLQQLNSACFVGGAGQNSQGKGNPSNNVDLPPGNGFGPGGGRRLADCIPVPVPVVVRDTGSAAGLISVAAATVAAALL